MRFQDCIAAIATPPGVSATGTIRVSGQDTIHIVNSIFKGKDLTAQPGNTLHFGRIVQENGEWVDEVVVSIFRSPRSYTGDDTCEISCHGSPFVLQKVMERLMESGARQAGPGEFTRRAFLNGKMDLSMAEAVGDLIAAENQMAMQSALFQLKGGISGRIKELRAELVKVAALFELELDFPEEDVEFADRTLFNELLGRMAAEVEQLISSFKTGKMIRNGISVAIVGRPNAGKSTLLNALLSEEKAIVSSIAGTTRDLIEDVTDINGLTFRFIDTAGLRDTDNEIEAIGIERAMERARKAHLVIYLFDANGLSPEEVADDMQKLNTDAPVLAVGNKMDLWIDPRNPNSVFSAIDSPLFISSKKGLAMEELKNRLFAMAGFDLEKSDYSQVTNARHYHSLIMIRLSVEKVRQGLSGGLYSEFIVQDIKAALEAMGAITGEISSDEILGDIFSKFCIGK